ncbi:MAG: M56 family metallopeptidase, partial [Clostridia bacterium]|nr:M56 family metallopeptidase [Clostridia bacterium]
MTTLLLLLTLSLAGSLMALLLFFCKPLLHRRISRRVWYYLWIPVLLRFCLPIGGVWPVFGAEAALPSEPGTSISDTTTSVTETTTRPTTLKTQQSSMTTLPTDTMSTEATTAPTTKSETTTDAAALLPSVGEDPPTGGATGWSFTFQPWMGGALWGAGAVLFLFSQLIAYWRLQGLLRRHSQPAGEAIQATLAALNGSHPLPQIRVCTAVSSPMLTGLVCPCIVLPQESYPPVELQNILLHELSHLHRGDLFYKWSALLVHTLHWFNPLLWLVRRELDTACEEACDESVIVSMSEQARKDYGNTLLNMASARRIAAGLVVTTMATPKKKLKERLVSIMTYRKMSARTIAFVLVFALVLCLSGCLIDSSVPPENIPGNDPVSEIDPTPESSENVSESDNPESSSMDADTSLDITVDTAVFTTKFSEKEMRAALDAYTRLLGAKAVSDRKLLLCAGFSEPQLKSVYLESRGSSFIKISRADFVRQMQTYVTEEWLENDLLFSCIKEEETWYFFDSDGMAVEGNTYTIDSITSAGEKTYLARISNKELYPIIDFTVRFAVAEQNGKCVIAYWQVTENHSGTKVDEIQRGDAATFTTKFSIEEVTAAKTVYDRLVGASQPRRMLIQMGFPFESDRNMEYDPDTNYQLTDVDYADYKAKALAYVSEEWFERHRYFSGNCKNEDGKLSFLEGGGSGYSRIIQQVIPTDHNTYLVREIGNEWAPGNVSTVEFAVAEHNGKCVIAYVGSNIDYQELPYPTEPTESYPVNA